MTEPKPITANKFHDALVEAGVVRTGDLMRRVVIDALVGGAVVMYVERFGDERLLDVVPTLDGVEIKGVPAPEPEAVPS